MKPKSQKRTDAKRKAEAMKAERKAVRSAKSNNDADLLTGKGKSIVPKSKKKK